VARTREARAVVAPCNDAPSPILRVIRGRSGTSRALDALRTVALAAITPLLEKNAIKTYALHVPLVFSMSRIVVLAFAIGMVRQLWKAGIAGWPEATVTMTIVLALPLLGALERSTPEKTLELVKTLFEQVGLGESRRAVSLFTARPQEPSRNDNHASD